MSLKELLGKEDPDVSGFDGQVQRWAQFVASEPKPNIANYVLQQRLLEHVKDEPIIGFEGSKAHLDGTYRKSTFAGIFSGQLRAILEDEGTLRNQIVSAYRFWNGGNDNIAMVTSDGRIVTIEENTTWELAEFDRSARNEALEAWPRVVGGATEDGKWHLYSSDFRTGIYHKHFKHASSFEEKDTPDNLKALVEKGEHAVSFSHTQGSKRKLIPSRSLFLTNRGLIVVRNAIGKDEKWYAQGKKDPTKKHARLFETQRWHFTQAKREYFLYPDGEVYDAAHPRPHFYRIDKTGDSE